MSRQTRIPRGAVSRPWVPAAAGTAALLIGILDIVKAVVPHFRESRISEIASVLPGSVTTLAESATLLVGILLIMLAHALRRRKVRAWRAVVVLLPVGAAVEALHRHPIAAAVSLGLFAVLVANRREFYALSDPRSRWRALGMFLALGAFDLLIGWTLVASRARTEIGRPGLSDQLQHVVLGLFGLEGPVTFTSERSGDLVYFSLAGLGALTAVTTIYLVLRPERPAAALTPGDEERLRALIGRYGCQDSLGYFALRRDKSVIFSPTGKAAIGYRVVAGVMLASGDPVGDVEAWPGAIRRFLDEAGRHAWVPAVIGCSETGGEVWTREGGLDALELGDEAIVEVADFTLEGRAMRNVRQMVNRVERLGYTCRVRRVGDLTEAETERIRGAADFWRGTETERGFSMALGRFGDPADGDCLVATAHKECEEGSAPGGDIRAILHFVPWGPDGISLDLMRRDRQADPGLNELLIVKALQAAPEFGVRRVSLNFAMFRSTLARGERLGAGPVLRAWRGVLVFLSRWFQIESLYKFNAKFRPYWEPRFLVYPTARDLPRIGVSALQAEAFLTLGLPRPGFLRRCGALLRRRRAAAEVLGPADGAVPGPHGDPVVHSLPDGGVEPVPLVKRPHGAVDLRRARRRAAAKAAVEARVGPQPPGELDGLRGGVGDAGDREAADPAGAPGVPVRDAEVADGEHPDHGAPPETAPDR
ncbi:phosphatidylglycerol lysyltransferase domain-containing protein [Microbispora corallina]|uniref:Membrane protein n=1 Tax=Microbispora corallina TaxID=83302 RepID=A0ABQ4G4K7_9ACTN|nr:phosphatidylglycerol lysyltransferase domain-containing protein [Microbispora corallina]GIH41965.1 membrane protein [Microbispora corallina]